MSPDRKVKAIKLKKDARGTLGIITIIMTEHVVDFARMVKQIGYRVSENVLKSSYTMFKLYGSLDICTAV
jgi:hypothetical protein